MTSTCCKVKQECAACHALYAMHCMPCIVCHALQSTQISAIACYSLLCVQEQCRSAANLSSCSHQAPSSCTTFEAANDIAAAIAGSWHQFCQMPLHLDHASSTLVSPSAGWMYSHLNACFLVCLLCWLFLWYWCCLGRTARPGLPFSINTTCMHAYAAISYISRVGRPYRDEQDRLLWKDKTCLACT